MSFLLCTIGFAGKTAEAFFSLLQEAGVKRVVDVRQKRSGQLSGFAKHPDLGFFLERIASITYVHEPLFAPSPELLKAYRRNKDWPAYEAGFLALMEERGVPESLAMAPPQFPIALLCSEPGPERCHRRLVADLLSEYWRAADHSVEIRHLVSAAPCPAPQKRKSRRSAA